MQQSPGELSNEAGAGRWTLAICQLPEPDWSALCRPQSKMKDRQAKAAHPLCCPHSMRVVPSAMQSNPCCTWGQILSMKSLSLMTIPTMAPVTWFEPWLKQKTSIGLKNQAHKSVESIQENQSAKMHLLKLALYLHGSLKSEIGHD